MHARPGSASAYVYTVAIIVFIRSVAENDPSPTYIVVGKLFRPCHSVHVLLFLPV